MEARRSAAWRAPPRRTPRPGDGRRGCPGRAAMAASRCRSASRQRPAVAASIPRWWLPAQGRRHIRRRGASPCRAAAARRAWRRRRRPAACRRRPARRPPRRCAGRRTPRPPRRRGSAWLPPPSQPGMPEREQRAPTAAERLLGQVLEDRPHVAGATLEPAQDGELGTMCQRRPLAHHVPAVDERQLRQLRSSGLGRRTSAGCRAARPATSRPAQAGWGSRRRDHPIGMMPGGAGADRIGERLAANDQTKG
jgi:hypothetical protein